MTARADLLALTPDDLATLANRGLVKRAQRDLESGAGPVELVESDGAVGAVWPDGSVVTLRPGEVIGEQCCTCAAVSICRHTIGTILAYQAMPRMSVDAEPTPVAHPWNPGEISDDALAPLWKPAVLAAARKIFDGGVVAEVQRAVKPLARIESLGVTLRFLVPHDPRYVQCDCAEDTPCRHVAIAVWAFRLLPPEQTSGWVSNREARYSAPQDPARECEELARGLFEYGLAAMPPSHLRRWEALPAALRKQPLIWPAEIAAEMLGLHELYKQSDARFHSAAVARLAGELLIRMRAIESGGGGVPQLLIRGPEKQEPSEIGSARLIGLGCHVEVRRKSVVLSVPMQDVATGAVLTARKEFPASERSFAELARTTFARSLPFSAFAAGQALIQGAKRSVNGELSASRAAVTLNPQAFEWDKLRAPVYADSIADLRVYRDAQPPAVLRPRRLGEDLHVCPVRRIADRRLDIASQRIYAVLEDAQGESLLLVHPYYTRGRNGFLRLWQAIEQGAVRYVAGRVRGVPHGLEIEPCAVVSERNGQLAVVLPWIDAQEVEKGASVEDWQEASPVVNALGRFLSDVEEALGEAALIGLASADSIMEKRWAALIEQGEQLGLDRFLEPARGLHAQLASRRSAPEWQPGLSVTHAVALGVATVFGSSSAG